MKIHIYYALLLAMMFSYCTKPEMDSDYYDLSSSKTLSLIDTVYRFDDKNISDMSVRDSVLFISGYQSDTCLTVINIQKKEVIQSFGVKGLGPEDLLNAKFIHTVNQTRNPYVQDNTHAKMLQIVHSDKGYHLEKLIDYPMEIFPSASINYSDGYLVGRKIDLGENGIFIYNRKNETVNQIDLFPDIPIDPQQRAYYLSSVLGLNEERGRIIAGMYFLDIIQVLNLEGEIINTVSFSKNNTPLINPTHKVFDLSFGFSGFSFIYPTDEFCYLMRKTETQKQGEEAETTKMIIQIDWDGNVINSYYIKENMMSQFCIDPIKKRLYTVSHEIDDLLEFNSIFAYPID